MVEIGHIVALVIGLVLGAWLWPKVRRLVIGVENEVSLLRGRARDLETKAKGLFGK